VTARRLSLLALLPCLLAFAPAPFPRKRRAAELDLTGTWEFVRWEEGGKSRPEPIRGWRGEAAGGRFDVVNPPAVEGAEASAPAARYYGTYRLRGGELTMIIAKGGTFAARPPGLRRQSRAPARSPPGEEVTASSTRGLRSFPTNPIDNRVLQGARPEERRGDEDLQGLVATAWGPAPARPGGGQQLRRVMEATARPTASPKLGGGCAARRARAVTPCARLADGG
jgi:hypothetical protein